MKRPLADDLAPPVKKGASIAYEFVRDELAPLEPTTRAMFGSTAVYVGEKVVFILRKKGDDDDGVWVAYEPEREPEVLAAYPRLVPIAAVPRARGWKKLAAQSDEFEADVLRACAELRRGESPLGKVPIRQKAKRTATTAVAKKKATKKKATKPTAKKPR